MAYLIDTNILIYSAGPSHAFLRALVHDADNYASAITKVETLGFHRLVAADSLYFNSVFAIISLLPVTADIIDRAIVLRQQRKMSLGDALIGATALEYDLTLATRNTADFASIPTLSIYDPFEL